ncbi:HAD-IC family P-type ATPase [Amnibacterium sp.]|uniref:HAD-IC family P-type ATPase n=1 Tax=Amnibacterium sp. TaxID=1872496 RepID=UPI003F7C17D3
MPGQRGHDPLLDEEGLSSAAVAARVADGLTNAVPTRVSRTVAAIIRTNVLTLFNAVVAGGFVLLLAIGSWRDALFGLSALANAVIGIAQELHAKRLLDRLAVVTADRAVVVRDGAALEVAARDLVLDDVLALRAGDVVVADAVVLVAVGLEVDESLLTGEADPVAKGAGERVLAGSSVLAGRCRARVDRIGSGSFAGAMTVVARRFTRTPSEIRTALDRVLRVIAWALVPVLLVALNGQLQALGGWEAAIRDGAWRDAVVRTVGAVIAMIPLGLVLLSSIALAAGAARLARRRVLLHDLASVEGLARVDVLCLDKTGTLTDGVVAFDAVHPLPGGTAPGWQEALGWFGADDTANRTALALRSAFPQPAGDPPTARVAFGSARRWSALQLPDPSGTWVLGAPEALLPDDAKAPLRAAAALASSGRRTLLLACTAAPLTVGDAEPAPLPAGLRPVAIVTLREQVRAEAPGMLDWFGREGVLLLVLSGDDPGTALAVARAAGLRADRAVDGRTLPSDPAELAALLERDAVFGRVAPGQKQAMVRALRASGHVVAMTGDGLNDVLALKEADLGIAMSTAPAATKAVARAVLLDDRFDRLPQVVAEGRKVIANIERLTMLALTKTVWAVVLPLVAGVLLWPLPFLPRQLSVLDGLTIGLPAFFLALRPNALRYRSGFLSRALGFAVPAGAIIACAILVTTATGLLGLLPPESASTAAFVVLGAISIWVLVVCARPLDVARLLVLGAAAAGAALLLVVPAARDFLGLVVPSPASLGVAAAISLLGCAAVEAVARRPGRRASPDQPVRGSEALRPGSRGGAA